MEIPVNELAEAKRQIDSILHKLRETIRTLEAKAGGGEKYRSQITLARRRGLPGRQQPMPAVRRAPVPVQLRNSCKGRFLSRSARLRIGFLRGIADYGKGMALSDIRHQ